MAKASNEKTRKQQICGNVMPLETLLILKSNIAHTVYFSNKSTVPHKTNIQKFKIFQNSFFDALYKCAPST